MTREVWFMQRFLHKSFLHYFIASGVKTVLLLNNNIMDYTFQHRC